MPMMFEPKALFPSRPMHPFIFESQKKSVGAPMVQLF